MPAFPDYSEFLVVVILIVYSAIILWDETWGIPMGEVVSPPQRSLITFFAVIQYLCICLKNSFPWKKAQLRVTQAKEGLCWVTSLVKPKTSSYRTSASMKKNPQKTRKKTSTYVPNIKHTGLRGPEKGGGDKINGFNWE